ncbi:DUF421 domain-containing protein [Minwuia thermotolerans]|uniref:YetF C-terminal domain-containing protein n=1 Tax=Minwuia thermotolerans TaxID=2056226 RepID=A0A2M9G2H2_9PROT|nr:YetF domain-containing protein [Minwuia thermotolerans]PJK29919.1 hypothetical protein CVT23_09115 [Minwuia thermotolerans]
METFYELIGRGAEPLAWWQMCIRAAIILTYAVALYRLMPRRAFGNSAAIDIAVMVIVGSCLSRALTGTAPLLPTLAAMALFAALYGGLSWAAYYSRWASKLVKGRSLLLVKDGEVDWKAMRLAQLGHRDLEENLRQNGVAQIESVAEAHLERDGSISVVRRAER